MKNFVQFVEDTSLAVKNAKRLGLVSNGHGDWYTRGGEFTAKTKTNPRTRKTELEFSNKRTRPGRQDPPQSSKERKLSYTTYEEKELREKYINKEIFNIDDWVQSLVTEQVGKIIRRGTNYLICVTEGGDMFKPWIKDVTDVSGVPADQREVGTDALRKYAETMVKGSTWGQHFINKYRKR